ncbi:MAG: PAS domain-containing sensor histidine kinase [Candidatus Omnitrophica bacterium]|nr:PAS domain-containing sensor histidine kinase [Candidatus Omnitrophota bacterium]
MSEHKYREGESRDYFYKIINSIPDPIFVKDREHRWVLLNEAHAQMIGIPTEEMLGKTDHDYFPKEQADVFWAKDEVVFETGGENVNEELWTDSKGLRHVIVTKKNLYIDDKGNKFIVGVIRDITDLKNTQEKLREAKEVQSRFTSVVSHELRTPLAAIRTGVNIILDGLSGPINSEQRDFLEIVKKNIERLSRLINDVLDFQKLDSGKMHFEMKPNCINEVIEEVCKAMQPLVEKKNLKFILNLDSNIPQFLFDKDKFIQVMANLLNNAIAFTDKGSITITSRLKDNNLHVMVEDTGVGISKESLPKLFRPFEQAERQDSGKRQGTGLGLAICKEIILKHKGNIWAEPKETGGSIFHFTLPLEGKNE